jgi:DNA-binding transcriptional regulator LsrR (DeoR family)
VGSTDGIIGDAGLPRVRRLAELLDGVTIPEVSEEFGVSDDTARRYVLRAVREGILKRTQERRRRSDVFGKGARGLGGVVYRVVRTEGDRSAWDDWRISRRSRT